MKTFSRILGTVALFLVAFFLIGVFIPRISYDIDIEINQPKHVVFQALTNSELLPKWVHGLESSELIDGQTGVPGSEYTMIINDGSKMVEFTETVLRFEPDSVLSYSLESQGIHGHIVVTCLESGADKTSLLVKTELEGTVWFTKSILPLIKGSIVKRNLTDYEALRSILN